MRFMHLREQSNMSHTMIYQNVHGVEAFVIEMEAHDAGNHDHSPRFEADRQESFDIGTVLSRLVAPRGLSGLVVRVVDEVTSPELASNPRTRGLVHYDQP
ncbi:hypothetical protein RISK_002285 [Rhodopirellula islandica]|uniref:Uncharacterized protein n=1 Tax=Rhodopirellula islandica TaxID=595434 RepID=A0A0J1BGI1_RHOIS|nr:hypothetical protein RISK_002285 [Rhodopirellula islandica]